MNRKRAFLKIISLFLIIIITVTFNAGCNYSYIDTPGKGGGDEGNLYYPNGGILMSENPFLLLYMNPEGLEGYLEVDGKIQHFYLIEMYTAFTSCVVALAPEYTPHEISYNRKDNVYMFCNLIHKTNHELVKVIDPETQGSSGEEFILKPANISKRDIPRKFEEFKNQSKQEILNYFKANI